ncbi:MAG: hypothetical protein ABR551_08335 [Gemmatimonadales bacterium]
MLSVCSSQRVVTRAILPAFILAMALVTGAWAQAPARPGGPSAAPFVVESYYRVRWGSFEEFQQLFERNHLPFLQAMLRSGVLLEVRIDTPREHMAEAGRWDMRTTLVYRDAASAYLNEPVSEAEYTAIVKDDQDEARFKREEQRRFALLDAHWDVNIRPRALPAPK